MKRNYNFGEGVVLKGPIKSKSQIDLAIKEQKVLTSIRIDKDVIDLAKKKAKAEGIGYLTWINRKLRSSVIGEDDLADRIDRLEKAVFKRKA